MFFKDKFSLKDYGDEFADSYIIFKLLDKNQTIKYSRTMANLSKNLDVKTEDIDKLMDSSEAVVELMYSTAKEAFISGEVFDEVEGKLRPFKKEDIDSLPNKVIGEVTQFIQGTVAKKD